jgi:hypothetical protein
LSKKKESEGKRRGIWRENTIASFAQMEPPKLTISSLWFFLEALWGWDYEKNLGNQSIRENGTT